MKLYKVGGRRPAEEDDGWTVYSRYILSDASEETFLRYLKEFKANGGEQPEQFVEYLYENSLYSAYLLDDPVVTHELEHREGDGKTELTGGDEE